MSTIPDQRFRKNERLRSPLDFARVYAVKCSCADPSMVVYVAPNDLSWSRLGRSVSRRVGNAVTRNYVRRRIREAFRLQKDALPRGVDIIVVARARAADNSWDIERSLCTLVGQAMKKHQRRGERA
ncbi:MAG: ribonuclease P protein component [Planctomycetota bacterium]